MFEVSPYSFIPVKYEESLRFKLDGLDAEIWLMENFNLYIDEGHLCKVFPPKEDIINNETISRNL